MSERFKKVPEIDARSYIARKAAIHRRAHNNYDKFWANFSDAPKRQLRELRRGQSVKVSPEIKEIERKEVEDGAFLAGLFEARGLMNIYKKEGKRKLPSGNSYVSVTTSPSFNYHDTREQKMIKLQERFGGNVHKVEGKNSYKWSVEGYLAVEIARKMQQFTHRRLDMTYAFINWENASKDERLQLIEDLKIGQNIEQDAHSYINDLGNPSFAAGVFEAGGAVEWHDGPQKASRAVRISTANSALLEALELAWNGKVVEYKPNSKYLKLGVNESEQLLEKVSPYLVSSLEEYRHIDHE